MVKVHVYRAAVLSLIHILAALLFPFLPVQRLSGWYPWQEFLGGQAGGPGGSTSIGGVEAAGVLSDDYAVSVRSGGLPDWDRVVFALWIAGLAVSLALVCREQLRLHTVSYTHLAAPLLRF